MIYHFTANTINCVCQSIRSMFRVLGYITLVWDMNLSCKEFEIQPSCVRSPCQSCFMGSMPNYPCFGLLLFYVGPISKNSCDGLVIKIICPKQKIMMQTNNKARVYKNTNQCCLLPQKREAMIETNPDKSDFNLQSIDDYYLRFRRISFLR